MEGLDVALPNRKFIQKTQFSLFITVFFATKKKTCLMENFATCKIYIAKINLGPFYSTKKTHISAHFPWCYQPVAKTGYDEYALKGPKFWFSMYNLPSVVEPLHLGKFRP